MIRGMNSWKKCGTCRWERPKALFTIDRRTADGFATSCNNCKVRLAAQAAAQAIQDNDVEVIVSDELPESDEEPALPDLQDLIDKVNSIAPDVPITTPPVTEAAGEVEEDLAELIDKVNEIAQPGPVEEVIPIEKIKPNPNKPITTPVAKGKNK